jgi:hypothetical protein
VAVELIEVAEVEELQNRKSVANHQSSRIRDLAPVIPIDYQTSLLATLYRIVLLQ